MAQLAGGGENEAGRVPRPSAGRYSRTGTGRGFRQTDRGGNHPGWGQCRWRRRWRQHPSPL
ncbi:MAG: hypothetical protein CMI00_16915, partial [Oceanospirillaceae bacterium]|nr:hypothetical protein [Oceanospirillaceae bacterium]